MKEVDLTAELNIKCHMVCASSTLVSVVIQNENILSSSCRNDW